MNIPYKAFTVRAWIIQFITCLEIAVAASLAITSAHADSELTEKINQCAETYRTCFTDCNRKEESYTNKKSECQDRQRAEDKRHRAAMDDCTGSWSRYRSAITKNYETESKACATADCKTKTENEYNLGYNGSWVGQHTCEQAEGAQHEDKQNRIDQDCVDYGGDPRAVGGNCRKECENDRNSCIREARESLRESGGGGAGRRSEPCPSGTRPNPLGQCVAVIRADQITSASLDDCPPGSARGPRDECVPKVRIIGVIRSADGWYIYCPKGTRPSPIDGGCVLDPGPGGADGPVDVTGRDCPPGTVPGPDDACIPNIPTGTIELSGRTTTPRPEMAAPDLSRALSDALTGQSGLRIMRVEDPARAVEITREQLQKRR